MNSIDQSLDDDFTNLLIDHFQYDRCNFGHYTSQNGFLLNHFLNFIEDWATNGFPLDFLLNKQFNNKISNRLFSKFLNLCELFGYGQQRGKNPFSDDYLLDRDTLYGGELAQYHRYILGSPRALYYLGEKIYDLLDIWYLGFHGDYAFQIGQWLVDLSYIKFNSADVISQDDWIVAEGDKYFSKIKEIRDSTSRWLAEKPHARPPDWPLPQNGRQNRMGCSAEEFVIERLNILKKLLMIEEESNFKIDVKLNAGAYPRGGRKPPSITHDTTFGIDIDIRELPPTAKKKFEDIERLFVAVNPEQYITIFSGDEPKTYFGDELTFKKTVIFTQAIALTGPSTIIFGDIMTLAAAYGGIRDVFNGYYPFQTKWVYEGSLHYNHWHIDWIPQWLISTVRTVPIKNVTWIQKQQVCKRTIEKNPIKRASQIQRPVSLKSNYSPAAEIDYINGIIYSDNINFGTSEYYLPLGDVLNFDKIKEWLDSYFLSDLGDGREIY